MFLELLHFNLKLKYGFKMFTFLLFIELLNWKFNPISLKVFAFRFIYLKRLEKSLFLVLLDPWNSSIYHFQNSEKNAQKAHTSL